MGPKTVLSRNTQKRVQLSTEFINRFELEVEAFLSNFLTYVGTSIHHFILVSNKH